MLLFFSISSFLNGIIFAVLGLLVYLNNPKRKLNRLYVLMSFSVAFWAISYGIWNLPQIFADKELALFWTRMLNFGSLFIPIFFSHWILTFLEIEKEKRNQIILVLGYLFTFFLAFFAFPLSPFTHYYVSHVEPKLFFFYWPKPGILYYFYLLFFWMGILGYVLFSLWKTYKKSSGYKKAQTKYILIGMILGFSGGGTNYFLWFDIPVAPWGNPLILSWAVIFPYVVLRYRFMDIRWILGRTGVYSLSFLTVLLYTFLLFFINQKLGTIIFPIVLDVFVVITAILLFLYFFRFFEKIAGKYFYYTFYILQTTLANLTKKLNQTIELDKLTNLINRSFLDAFNLDRVGIILQESEKKQFLPQQLIKYKEEDILALLVKEDNFLAQYLQKIKKPIVREEIPFFLQEKDISEEEKRKLNFLKEEMEKREIGLFLPLFIEEELIGIIILGDKLSREAYTVQDFDLLINLTTQVSIAFNNALSYAEIKKRKADLEKFYKLTVGRELRMVELKKKIKELEERLKKES